MIYKLLRNVASRKHLIILNLELSLFEISYFEILKV